LIFSGVLRGDALSGTFEELTNLLFFAAWMFNGMAWSRVPLRKTEPLMPRPYRAGAIRGCRGFLWLRACAAG